jgi:hypothetical protein
LLWFDERAAVEPAAIERLDFIRPDAIIRRLEVGDKLAAIAALVNRLHATGHLGQEAVASVIAAMTRREELGSTGIGRGFPSRTPGIRPLVASSVLSAILRRGSILTASTVPPCTPSCCCFRLPTGRASICGRWNRFRGPSDVTANTAGPRNG